MKRFSKKFFSGNFKVIPISNRLFLEQTKVCVGRESKRTPSSSSSEMRDTHTVYMCERERERVNGLSSLRDEVVVVVELLASSEVSR